MKTIDKIYINGEFITPEGTEYFDLINPTTNEKLGKVLLGNKKDTQTAIAAAKEAFKTFSKTTITERIQYLKHSILYRKKKTRIYRCDDRSLLWRIVAFLHILRSSQ